ncbi:Probable 26S proteasome regulatory subunit p27 AltName: Full=Proteasome non-ATPase subunit 2 [Cyberlindnera jadinii]|uniref:NAS2 protein n=1 Tax=Cyberlindnera jadinii (strain ATCC 18201 / CBS 1600 / BCRC 20928 / JCM 3617 / NBRC 0987 / NRRL Y-1542) TaxID=983966 RepID=A0A0H5C425_CYBJN|nr:Probable 26S proteasome regulatory subunit p27 AltName: Full=Proteasome non-ATPase subunit 2 [Cyberlindnera jadinii]
MDGELRPLRTDDYDPSYDINNLSNYDFEKLTLIKLEVESELHILAKRLEANKADMQTPLLSSDGFPRSDIDVVEVRTTRVKIIKLKNDLRSVMEEISSRLLSQFQTNAFCKTLEISQEKPVPFAIITEVVSNSPAEFSGLKVQDKVVRFGDIDATNHNDLRNIAPLVKNKVNVSTNIFNMAFKYAVTVILITFKRVQLIY